MKTADKINIFWFRRDLRLEDNTGLYHALRFGLPVLPVFIFDTGILDKLPSRTDPRVEFIYKSVIRLKTRLEKKGSSLLIMKGKPAETLSILTGKYSINGVYTNHDYEPYAISRDNKIRKLLSARGINFHSFKDQVIFEKSEVTKKDGSPYTVFTPYSKAWLKKLSENENSLAAHKADKFFPSFFKTLPFITPGLNKLGFSETGYRFPSSSVNKEIIKNYHKTRDIPCLNRTSNLSVHLRFGTISIRKLTKLALKLNKAWLNELIWREFFMMILFNFPLSSESSFKPAYSRIKWLNSEPDFKAWCEGKTGYPIVDAAMRQLNSTGLMHNRARMIAAGFLTKHLLIDWRWGEKYFADKLLDYEMSSNVGNWQWAAGSGCDAAPYFRIFNPETQAKKFDPEFIYIKKWVPEFGTHSYPAPVVEYKLARQRAITAYKSALKFSK